MSADRKTDSDAVIASLIAARWSPRAYDDKQEVTQDLIDSLLEAARWAPSCFNSQPWRFVVGSRASHRKTWETLAECLNDGNRKWAGRAPLLIAVIADCATPLDDGSINSWAEYDSGAAAENLCLQAFDNGLVAHQMAGFDRSKVRTLFSLPDEWTPMAVIAIGYPGDPEILEDWKRDVEQAPRERKHLSEFVYTGPVRSG